MSTEAAAATVLLAVLLSLSVGALLGAGYEACRTGGSQDLQRRLEQAQAQLAGTRRRLAAAAANGTALQAELARQRPTSQPTGPRTSRPSLRVIR